MTGLPITPDDVAARVAMEQTLEREHVAVIEALNARSRTRTGFGAHMASASTTAARQMELRALALAALTDADLAAAGLPVVAPPAPSPPESREIVLRQPWP